MNKATQKYYCVLLILLIKCPSITALKLARVILATDSNPTYIQFWPVTAKVWKKMLGVQPTLALIADETVTVDESLGDVIRFKPIEGVPTWFYAQNIRLLLPAYFPNDVCLLADIDIIPLQNDFYIQQVAHIPDNNFVVYCNRQQPDLKIDSFNAPAGLFAICYNAAKGKTFKEIFSIDDLTKIPDIIKQWYSYNIGWATDEKLLYHYVISWKYYKSHCVLLNHTIQPMKKRIDRMSWHYNLNLLKQGYYIDAHMLRPYQQYKTEIDTLIKHLGISIK